MPSTGGMRAETTTDVEGGRATEQDHCRPDHCQVRPPGVNASSGVR